MGRLGRLATVRTEVWFGDAGAGRVLDPRLHRHMFRASLRLGRYDQDAATVAEARDMLGAATVKHAADLGFYAQNWRWVNAPTDSDDLATGVCELSLEAEMRPLVDGVWPALRRAVAEDVSDREAVRLGRTRIEWTKPGPTYHDAVARAAADWGTISRSDGLLPQDTPPRRS